MRSSPYWLGHLNTCSPADGTVWIRYGKEDAALREKVLHHWGGLWEFKTLARFQFDICRVFVVENMSSQLPAPATVPATHCPDSTS